MSTLIKETNESTGDVRVIDRVSHYDAGLGVTYTDGTFAFYHKQSEVQDGTDIVKETIHADQLADMLSAASKVYFGMKAQIEIKPTEELMKAGDSVPLKFSTKKLAKLAMDNILTKMANL